jgi:hypothetical protein
MRAALRQFFLAASAMALCATVASAQARPVSLGVTGGASVPTGDRGDGLQTGFNVGGLLEVAPAVSPVGLRLEGGYHRFDYSGGVNGNDRLITGIANGVVKFPGSVARPYLIGGVGAYNLGGETNGTSRDSETNIGLNGGVGIDIPLSGIATFVEARYHTVFRDDRNFTMLPISVGIRF